MSFKHILVRGYLNYDTDKASLECGQRNDEPSLTIQSQKDDADINTIVRRFGLTGQLPQGVRVPALEGFVEAFDYKSAMLAIIEADRSFMAMPAEVRSRFNNDPAAFVDFCADEANLDEMRRLGLAVPKAENAPPPADVSPVITPASSGPSVG